MCPLVFPRRCPPRELLVGDHGLLLLLRRDAGIPVSKVLFRKTDADLALGQAGVWLQPKGLGMLHSLPGSGDLPENPGRRFPR